MFIDCNKKDYDAYYEAALKLLRTGGVIVVDNIFWNGAVLRADAQEKSTRAIRALAHKMHGDARINLAVLPIGDGMTLDVATETGAIIVVTSDTRRPEVTAHIFARGRTDDEAWQRAEQYLLLMQEKRGTVSVRIPGSRGLLPRPSSGSWWRRS